MPCRQVIFILLVTMRRGHNAETPAGNYRLLNFYRLWYRVRNGDVAWLREVAALFWRGSSIFWLFITSS